MTEQELNEKYNIHQVIQKAMETAHYNSAPETKIRLKTLEDNDVKLIEEMQTIKENQEKHSKMLSDYIESDRVWREGDKKWKEEYEPYIKGLASLTNGSKIWVWIMGGVAGLSAGVIAIKQLFK